MNEKNETEETLTKIPFHQSKYFDIIMLLSILSAVCGIWIITNTIYQYAHDKNILDKEIINIYRLEKMSDEEADEQTLNYRSCIKIIKYKDSESQIKCNYDDEKYTDFKSMLKTSIPNLKSKSIYNYGFPFIGIALILIFIMVWIYKRTLDINFIMGKKDSRK